jgi:histidinol-phosphate/aromatic aminotransferase/cobyric acid decarboxylase-like protein
MIKQLETSLCFHGGALYDYIGDDFAQLDQLNQVIDADVLDAWFDPSPRAIHALSENLAWSLRSSPPVSPTGVERLLGDLSNLSIKNIVCGAGSSSLIFLALREMLSQHSRVLILDPTYGEYAHVLSKVIGCKFDSFPLSACEDYKVDLNRLVMHLNSHHYDLVILVNPNNPSGKLIPRAQLEDAIKLIPRSTTIWIDEAYIDYAGRSNSLGEFAATVPNVIVCKSLSKVLALSGLRVAYLISNTGTIRRLKNITPPWSLSLPAQLVLSEALLDGEYYDKCYALTHQFREDLANELSAYGYSPRSSTANFILVDYPETWPVAQEVIAFAREHKLLLRDIRSMGTRTSQYSFRVSIKDAQTNLRIANILRGIADRCWRLSA